MKESTASSGGMIDITEKPPVRRTATASGKIKLKESTVQGILAGGVKKGDALTAARIAAVLAVKDTPRIIPMCHTIPITSVDVDFNLQPDVVQVWVTVTSLGRTGVEMEALTGAAVAMLTVWDMVKYLEKDETGNYPETVIEEIRVVEKRKEAVV